MLRILKILTIIKFLREGMGGVLRESVIKNSGGKILLNNTQKYHSINSTVWKCSYSIGTLYILNGGVQKKMISFVYNCLPLFNISSNKY